MAVCRYHPDRAGVGICMRCRAVICASCSTQVEGINHCFACLKALAARPVRPVSSWSPLWSAGLVLAGSWLILFVLLLLVRGSQ